METVSTPSPARGRPKIGDIFRVRLPDTLRLALTEAARSAGVSRSTVVRAAVLAYLASLDRKADQ
jgi:metal-responsive CopG/Arc/MetJ family transcriptional regulator